MVQTGLVNKVEVSALRKKFDGQQHVFSDGHCGVLYTRVFYLFTSTDFALTHADPIHRVNKNSLWH